MQGAFFSFHQEPYASEDLPESAGKKRVICFVSFLEKYILSSTLYAEYGQQVNSQA